MQLTTITQKGQVTIPIDIRRFLQVKAGDQVAFVKNEEQIMIKPAQKFLDLKGSVRAKYRFSDKKTDKSVANYISKTYAQKTACS